MKRIVSVLLILALMLAPCGVIAEESVSSEWAKEYVDRAMKLNWTLPQDFTVNITRGEFCYITEQFLYSAGLDVNFFSMDTPFTDIGEGYTGETGAIKYLYCLNIVEGKSETLFYPDDLLTREEAAVIIERIIDCFREWEIADITTNEEEDFIYRDYKEISSWAAVAVYNVRDLGIMKGTGTYFEPKKQLTYEETVTMLIRLYDLRWSSSIGSSTFADKLNTFMPEDENYMFSPLSIKMVLMLAANGADEETDELIAEFFDEHSAEDYNEKAKALIEKYSESKYLCANVSNSIWVNKSMTNAPFAPELEKTAQEFYNAHVGIVDKDNAAQTVNKWVEDKTNGKINSILPEDYNDFYTALVNAIYFNGKWQKKFNEKNTIKDKFTNADGTIVETDFMNQTATFKYYSDDTTRIVEMPYEILFEDPDSDDGIISLDLDMGMYIIMSDEDINLEEKLLHVEAREMNSRRVKLSIPKFEFEYSQSLRESLSQLGLGKIFEEACFDHVLENEALFVDDILHKTYIKVNEEGTEAAAATALVLKSMGMPEEIVEFKADKPFYFVIRDNDSGEILFMGRYAYAE